MKPKTPIQVLGKSLSRSFNKFIATKDDIINKVLSNSTKLNPDQFMKAIENFTDSQWKSLIQSINDRIRLRENQPFKVARKKARKLAREERAKREEEKAKQTALKEEAAEEELLKIISEDEYLKNHNIAIVEIVNVFEDEYVVKVYLICGGYFIEGTIKEIISTIRRELKKNKVTVRIFCPACSSKKFKILRILLFMQ
jgi:hypothetical protein